MNSRSHSTVEVLQGSALFEKLSEETLSEMLRSFRHETWTRRSPAMTRQQSVERFYVVVSGRLRIFRVNPKTGRELSLFLLGPGDAFDIVTLLDRSPHGVSTIAVDDLEVISAPIGRVREWIDLHPEFNQTFLPYLGRQMRALSELASDLALFDTDIRLAKLILQRADPQRPGEGHRLINDLPHEVLASMIGSVRVVVNRHIQYLKEEGLIAAHRGQLTIKKLDAMGRRCEDALDRTHHRLEPPAQ